MGLQRRRRHLRGENDVVRSNPSVRPVLVHTASLQRQTDGSVVASDRMQPAERRRATAAALSTASALGLAVDDAVVLSDSNRLVLRLLPCDIVARITPVGYRVFAAGVGAAQELDVVRLLAELDAPIAVPDPRVEARVFVQDGFEIALLTYYEPVPSPARSPEDYAGALVRLHALTRQVDATATHFTDRVADVQRWVVRHDESPDLTPDDRDLLANALEGLTRSIVERGAPEQLLHGEPHPWNVLDTVHGPLFVDFENCVRGPVEFDLGWVPRAVSGDYPGVDRALVEDCHGLVLAIVGAHGWRRRDVKPGRESGVRFLDVLRTGPPWPSLESV
jgi:hypothetical protein